MKHPIVLLAVFLSLKITARKPEMPSIIDLDAMTNPHVFSCDGYLKHDSDNGGFNVHYSSCDVEYPKRLVQKKNGTFTVKRDGIYRLTFKASTPLKYTSKIKNAGSTTIEANMFINGRRVGSSFTSHTGKIENKETYIHNSINLLHELDQRDEVYVEMAGRIFADDDCTNQIFFTG